METMGAAIVGEEPLYRTEKVPCYVCRSEKHETFLLAGDDYTGRKGVFRMVRCGECGLAYQNPRLTLDEVKSFYDDSYISHRKQNFGKLHRMVDWAMSRHDHRKCQVVSECVPLARKSRVLDVGCAAGGFLRTLHQKTGAFVHGVDFKDFAGRPGFENIHFHHGLFCEQEFGDLRFDLITMWHYLEHDYDPIGSLRRASELLSAQGRLVVEVPRLDSMSFRLFKKSWPGVQLPQHTMMLDKAALLRLVERPGLEIVEYRPYGAFPSGFYLFLGTVFFFNKGKGIESRKLLLPYFLSQLLLFPLTIWDRYLNICMQTVICRRKA